MLTPEEQVRAVARRVLEDVGMDMVDDIRSSLSESYPPPSSPGESPHRRTGELVGSVSYALRDDGDTVLLELGSDAPYAVFLETGTAIMAARPFMAPALERWGDVIAQRLQDAYDGSSPVVSPAGAIIPAQSIAA